MTQSEPFAGDRAPANAHYAEPMRILNLGSGIKTSPHADVTNVDWSIYLRLGRSRVLRRVAPRLLKGKRRERFASLPENIVVHDLARGLPFPDESVDVVYHSHLLEHLDHWVAPKFMAEVRRVLKAGGLQRIVVPDLERLSRTYLDHLDECSSNREELARHDDYVAAMIEQSVRREAYGTRSRAGPLHRFENLLIGDARRRGETHQWMYDRANLTNLLELSGFEKVQIRTYDSSAVPSWDAYGLDHGDAGDEYKPGSLYAEAIRPPWRAMANS